MSGHTPGPWVVYVPDDYDGQNSFPGLGVESAVGRAVVWYALEPETGLANDADAYLIAAAPDLLSALKITTGALEAAVDANGADSATHYICLAARAAIAKAEGKP